MALVDARNLAALGLSRRSYYWRSPAVVEPPAGYRLTPSANVCWACLPVDPPGHGLPDCRSGNPFVAGGAWRSVRTYLLVALLLAAPFAGAQPDPTGEGVTIAVVDTGIDSGHPEFSGRVARQSFVEPGGVSLPGDLGGVLPQDSDGQGTATASVAAGLTLGMAPGAALVDLQVSFGGPLGDELDREDEQATIAAMEWLLRNAEGPTVVLVSVAARSLSEVGAATLAEQARGLHARGVAVVVPVAPEWSALHASPYVLTVGGLVKGQPAGAPGPEGLAKPDLVAAPDDLRVAIAGGPAGAGRGIGADSGNHLAAALVAGTLATLWDMRPDLPLGAALDILRDTAVDLADPGFDRQSGFGELNPPLAQQRADEWSNPLALGGRGERAPGLGILAGVLVLGAVAWRRR